jgi:hypothetical protein
MVLGLRIVEREEGGRTHSSEHGGEVQPRIVGWIEYLPRVMQMSARTTAIGQHAPPFRLVEFAAKVFLPAGYPSSVSPGA